jgi:hypothetical protein
MAVREARRTHAGCSRRSRLPTGAWRVRLETGLGARRRP